MIIKPQLISTFFPKTQENLNFIKRTIIQNIKSVYKKVDVKHNNKNPMLPLSYASPAPPTTSHVSM